MGETNVDLFGEEVVENELLRDQYIVPPFSVLDAKSGIWQHRKNEWKALGIKSEVGRDAECLPSQFGGGELGENGLDKYGRKPMSGQSIFDPVLCEIVYRWFCPEGGDILDPFAGGSVRGIVANYLGYNYTGVDLSQEQIKSNREQASNILAFDRQPNWYCGDSDGVLEDVSRKYDLVFSCPPYHDLEVYSDNPDDLSNMTYLGFLHKYESIIIKSLYRLKVGCYAVFVVADIRDKKTGYYKSFVAKTIDFFERNGAPLYNDMVFLEPLGTAMLRAKRIMGNKKVVKVHQNVLVFKKK